MSPRTFTRCACCSAGMTIPPTAIMPSEGVWVCSRECQEAFIPRTAYDVRNAASDLERKLATAERPDESWIGSAMVVAAAALVAMVSLYLSVNH